MINFGLIDIDDIIFYFFGSLYIAIIAKAKFLLNSIVLFIFFFF